MKYTKAQQKTKDQTISLHGRHRIVAQRKEVSADWTEGMQAGYDAGYTDALEYIKNDLHKRIVKIEKLIGTKDDISKHYSNAVINASFSNVIIELKSILEKL